MLIMQLVDVLILAMVSWEDYIDLLSMYQTFGLAHKEASKSILTFISSD